LARGLCDIGIEARLVDAEPGRSLRTAAKAWATIGRRSRHGGMYAREIRGLYRLVARRRAASSSDSRFDAVIQMGSDFGIPFFGPLVTYEDMTVRQFARVEPRILDQLGDRGLEWWALAQAACYEAAVGCCVASRWAAESIVADYGVPESKVHVVGFGRNYDPRPVDRDWRHPRFLFMGFDWTRKNGPRVLRAFARLKEQVPEARLDVVGGHPRIEMNGVVTHGPLDMSRSSDRARAESLFQRATCFVMPSLFEPFGMVYIEAAAAGVPSIGTIVGGARDAIGEEGGLLVDPSNDRELAQAMTAMCDPGRASAMGAAAFERSRRFTWRAVAERIKLALGPR
jgi:glycogen synthase